MRLLASVTLINLAISLAVCQADERVGAQLNAIGRVLPVLEALANGAGHPEFVSAAGNPLDLEDKPLALAPWDVEQVARYFARPDAAELDEDLTRVDLLARAIRKLPVARLGSERLADDAGRREIADSIGRLSAEYKSLREQKLGVGDNMRALEGTDVHKLVVGLWCPADSASGRQVTARTLVGALRQLRGVALERLDLERGAADVLREIERRTIVAGNAPVQVLSRVLLKDLAPSGTMRLEGERAKFQRYMRDLGREPSC